MRVILSLLRVLVALLILATALPALLALAGFWVPVFDLFNHLQLLLFFGTLAAAIAALPLRMRRWWQAFALLGFLASAWTFVPEWLSSLSPRQAVSDVTTIKVMTHNIFGLNYDMARVDAAIREEDPDIVALQEFFPEQAGLGDLLKGRYPYAVRCQGGKRANLGLYSKFPFQEEMAAGECPENAQGTQRTAHIIVGFTLSNGTSFSLLTTHMDWPLPIERQRDEFAAAATAANAIDGPLLVVGDFNSTPWSATMKAFEASTGLRRETRNLITYPELFTVPPGLGRRLPLLPIEPKKCADGECYADLLHTEPFLPLDQVFQRGVIVSDLHLGAPTGSDHLPVIFTFSVAH
jgi:endonuclease/exonuclease/phosphatase (EEP) superfamily protein YafD